jgi:hypothetical protein
MAISHDKSMIVVRQLYGKAVTALAGDSSVVNGTMLTLRRSGNSVRILNQDGIYVTLTGTVEKFGLEIGKLICTEEFGSLRYF